MSFRKYLAGATIVAWFILPFPYSNHYGLRLLQLFGLPLAINLVVYLAWKRFEPSKKTESLLNRILSVLIALTLFAFAVDESMQKEHLVNDQVIRTHDGYEEVGDYIAVSGPDRGNIIMLIAAGVAFFWFGALRKEKE